MSPLSHLTRDKTNLNLIHDYIGLYYNNYTHIYLLSLHLFVPSHPFGGAEGHKLGLQAFTNAKILLAKGQLESTLLYSNRRI